MAAHESGRFSLVSNPAMMPLRTSEEVSCNGVFQLREAAASVVTRLDSAPRRIDRHRFVSRMASNIPVVRRRWRTAFRVSLVIAFIVCVNYFAQWLGYQLEDVVGPGDAHGVQRIVIVALLVYTLLIAVPFVPSVEVGLGLIMLLGAELAPLVYLFTVVGLSLSFIVGMLIPEARLQKFLEDLSLTRASRLVESLKSLSTEERLSLLVSRAPAKFIPTLVRHRYVAVAVAFNIPGNTLIGGGGGIALAAGMSRLFGFWQFMLTLAIAVSPVPLLIVLCGTDILL
jgi:hypothetical protein